VEVMGDMAQREAEWPLYKPNGKRTKAKHQSAVARHSSETAEHFTPAPIVEAARTTLGGFDLDPATTRKANEEMIHAKRYFTKDMNGYLCSWSGRIFLNPPGGWCDQEGRLVIKASKGKPGCVETGECGLKAPHTHEGTDSSQKRWWQKLAITWAKGDVTVAIFVCFSVELLQSSQVDRVGPLPLMFPICYPSRRVSYLRADGGVGKSPPHASCIICLTDDVGTTRRFEHAFRPLGHVVVPREEARRYLVTWPSGKTERRFMKEEGG
jgi:hypothetical protein